MPFLRRPGAPSRRARRVLAEWEALERFARDPAAACGLREPPRVGLCCPEFDGVDRLEHLISAVTGKVLGCDVEVELAECAGAADQLREGRFDALITLEVLSGTEISCTALGTLTSEVLLAADHPLAACEEVTIEELGDYPVLYPMDFSHFCHSVIDAYVERGLRSERVEAGTHEISVAHFTSNRGFSFIVAGNVTGGPNGLSVRPVAPADMVPSPIFLSTTGAPGGIDAVAFRRALSHMSLLG